MTRSALARHPLAIAGMLVTTASAVVFVALVIASLWGMFTNPYAGLVVFVAIPVLFVAGLVLIPAGMWLQQQKLRRHPDAAAADWPVLDFRLSSVRKTALLITALTAVNIVIILLAGYGSLHYMDSPGFCGQTCHTPMHPQFQAWQGAVHAGVPCASCHIGEGAGAFVHAKLSGVRQLLQVATTSYPRPIPSGAKMPAGAQAETCTGCHKPGRIVGDRVRIIREYSDDEKNSETMSAYQMHLSVTSSSERGIHWHANPEIRVEYVAADAGKQTIPYVKVTDANGAVKEYVAADATEQAVRDGERRTMDCVDCHNTVGHPIAQSPEQGVDRALAAALLSRDLPFARREGVRLMKATYSSQDDALREIDRGLRSFYESRGESKNTQAVARSVTALQDLYRGNVFPAMKVTWGTYPDNKGHINSPGCFRCHDDSHKAKDGTTISGDCEYCHKQLK